MNKNSREGLPSPPMSLRLPIPFGRYTLLEKLGHGGMGAVYRAEMKGIGGFSKIVAIKLVHPHVGLQQDFNRSFIDEARLGGYLAHPNIAATLDFGEINGRLFLAMELVEGASLDKVIGYHLAINASIPIDAALQLMAQVCRGLDHAHRAVDRNQQPMSIVHRDLKPSNILLDRHGLVKIADFGIARAAINEVKTEENGQLKGTMLYMSPEQASGKRDIDHRSDLFTTGLILYELLTLVPLYDAPTSLHSLRLAQEGEVGGLLQRLPESPVRELLILLLSKLLARVPAERVESAGETALQLEELRAGLPQRTDLVKWLAPLLRDVQSWVSEVGASAPVESDLNPGWDISASGLGSHVPAVANSAAQQPPEFPGDRAEGTEKATEVARRSEKKSLWTNAKTCVNGKQESAAEPPRVPRVHLNKASRVLVSVGLIVLAAVLRWHGLFDIIDNGRQDLYASHLIGPPDRSSVAIIDLGDDVDVWPWRRELLARLFERLLLETNARSVTLDVVLSAESQEAPAEFARGNQHLAEIIRQSGKPVILAVNGSLLPADSPDGYYRLTLAEPLPPALAEVPTGFAALLAPGRRGGPARRMALTAISERPDGPPVAFALSAATVAAGSLPLVDVTARRIRFSGRWIAADPYFRVEIPFIDDKFPTVVKAAEVLKPGPLSDLVLQQVKDRALVLGRYSDPMIDRVATPWGYRPGVEVQATLIAQLFQGQCRHRWGGTLDLLLQVIFLGVFAWLARGRTHLRRCLLAMEAGGLALATEVTAVLGFALWINAPVAEFLIITVTLGWMALREGNLASSVRAILRRA